MNYGHVDLVKVDKLVLKLSIYGKKKQSFCVLGTIMWGKTLVGTVQSSWILKFSFHSRHSDGKQNVRCAEEFTLELEWIQVLDIDPGVLSLNSRTHVLPWID